ncbi:4Fe-4S binding protein [Paracraurococcus lichenis]|uniref:4Fe-4S binding protein n=1 Tax=Paracraurococcus lichenis TaxID=3064888 RepID=A0ABT9E0P2_9PROT|nr:4Fe-4S binding protein [Paracraurococcus sp. LOR1-02]MDO9709733.1 4Fe-4S binding protein [Paracraurococcus sp. LOR1-02]
MPRLLARGLILLVLLLPHAPRAGTLDRAAMERLFPAPLVVGEKEASPPVWPIFRTAMTSPELVAYAFESADLAPIPGFSGVPPNLLVALGPDGSYLDVRVLSHHEPVFLEGLGEEPLHRFVAQYAGLGLRQSVKVGSATTGASRGGSAAATIDGVAKATASVRIINESVLAAALAVARAKLGFAAGRDPGLRVTPREDAFEPLPWPELLRRGLVRRVAPSNAEVERGFAGTSVAGMDAAALAAPEAAFAEIHIAYLNTPVTGRNLLGEAGWRALQRDLEGGHHAILLLSSGRWDALGEDFVRGAVPDRVALIQDGLPIGLRDIGLERIALPPGAPEGRATILRIGAQAGLDPSQPWALELKVTRERGQIFPERVSQVLAAAYEPQPGLFLREAPDAAGGWRALAAERAAELGLLAAALALLLVALARQRWLTASPRGFALFRAGFLLFTLGVIGWQAQAQLSVVTLAGLVRAAAGTGDLSFLLYDPASLLLWGVTLATLVAWGRGTFCGWLCPFGALQELARQAAAPLRLRQVRVPPRWDARLRRVKYLALALVLGSALLPAPWAEAAAELEPFKTAITLGFDRSWPFVLYAGGLVVANLVLHKAFCRWLCPLGAALVLGGRLRVPDWLARREACGSPCQLCRVRCDYGAIRRDGGIDYDACFQCMDCVVIHNDRRQCVPLVLADRRAARGRGA